MTTPKRNGSNPCLTSPGSVRRFRYFEHYTSKNAADFANVPKATVYRAMRVGQLATIAVDYDEAPKITHGELVRWMQERGFPVPEQARVPMPRPLKAPIISQKMNVRQAAELAQVTGLLIEAAIDGGALPCKRFRNNQVVIERDELRVWLRGGKRTVPREPWKRARLGLSVIQFSYRWLF
ncbi:hypothetical protein GCM10022631_30230 [Deinococcus rubellus]|uniref:hypothetical protein n=1 Tax=Deinococcus rubellus TaxID=1889240 RepID=UPI0031ED7E39